MQAEPGEEIFFHGHPSWRSILSFWIKGVVAMILAGIVAGLVTAVAAGHVQVGWVAVVVFAILAVALILGTLRRISTTYSITSRRLTIERGILSREMHETRLERVQNVGTRQSPVERLLRVGTVDFDTAAGDNFDFAFVGVENPRTIVRTVDRALQQRLDAGSPSV